MKATITLLLVLFISLATFGQTTETRYYNGKYTKETALQKINSYITKRKNEGFVVKKIEEGSPYQLFVTYTTKSSVSSLTYLIGDNSIIVKLVSVTANGKYILKDDKTPLGKLLYDGTVDIQIKNLFKYLAIEDNTTSKQTTTTGSNTNTTDLYSGLSAEAKAFMETYKTNPNGLKNYVQNLHKSWEEKGSSTSDINAKYIDMYQELYAKDKASAFELLMKLPFKWKEPHLKTITTFLTDEQKAYNRQKAQEVQKKYSNSYDLKTN